MWPGEIILGLMRKEVRFDYLVHIPLDNVVIPVSFLASQPGDKPSAEKADY
jgi:hypothetical protein